MNILPAVLISLIFGTVQLLVVASRTEVKEMSNQEILWSVKRYRNG